MRRFSGYRMFLLSRTYSLWNEKYEELLSLKNNGQDKNGGRMRQLCLFIFCLVMVFIQSLNATWLNPCTNSDECGKVVGSILDNDTNEVIKEDFSISIVPYSGGIRISERDYYVLHTLTGKFETTVKAGTYVVIILPYSAETKYSGYFNPYLITPDHPIIHVEKGKVTEIRKKINTGGSLKIILEDMSGRKINFNEYFNKEKIKMRLKNASIGFEEMITWTDDEILSGEKVLNRLVPGIYKISTIFNGYGIFLIDPVNIELKKITEVGVKINPSDKTGIEGVLKDKNGVILKNFEIFLYRSNNDEENCESRCSSFGFTDESGHFKIIGLNEGIYSLHVEDFNQEFDIVDIKITENQMLTRDFVIDTVL